MITKSLLTVCEEEDNNIAILRHVLEEETETGKMFCKQKSLQRFGALVLLILGTGTFVPASLHISTGFRPWVSIAFVLWVFVYCTGMFNP